ncbi:hypothetical protein PZH32_03065 [Adlercreutzia equolifaciens]|uniref:spermidine synthase n=1 Tax=Adlercreutzia equolifaciens TaxID=446660 RepID=UPI0023AF5F3A|nr:hypothetical protein [Adlercreutzia equolifaciens]MDE8701937.1 hypothetical protein [Adlercreutzia equolifaciens]
MFGEATVYAMPAEDGSLVRMLNVGGVLQSATYLDERWAQCPFAYLRSFDHMFEAQPTLTLRRVLMIGGAGFAYPKRLLVAHPGVQLDVVEIDPAMVDLARQEFFLDRLEAQLDEEGRAGDLSIFTEDGEAFLRRGACRVQGLAADVEAAPVEVPPFEEPLSQDASSGAVPYDAIIIDAFVGREAVPFFASDEGATTAKACLSPGGLLMANCVAEYTGDAMYRLFSQVERLREHFANVYVIDASDEEFGGADNYLLIATDGTYPFTGVIPYGD